MQTIRIFRGFNIIVGPTCSGKTYLVEQIQKNINNEDFYVVNLEKGMELANDEHGYIELCVGEFAKALSNNKTVLVDCAYTEASEIHGIILIIRRIMEYKGTISIIKFDLDDINRFDIMMQKEEKPSFNEFFSQKKEYYGRNGIYKEDFSIYGIKEQFVDDINYKLIFVD